MMKDNWRDEDHPAQTIMNKQQAEIDELKATSEMQNILIELQQAEIAELRSALSLVLEARTFYSGVQKKNNVPIYLSVKEWDSLSELLSKA